MAISPKLPTINQLITLMIALAVISIVFKNVVPEQYRAYFRI